MKLYTAKTPARAIKKTIELVKGEGRGLDKRIYVFCESRASLSHEITLCAEAGGSFNTQILSFARYVLLNSEVENYLNKTAATLVVRKIIDENADKLIRLKRGGANLATNVYNLISQLKSAKIKVGDLERIASSEGGAFGSKLADVILLYGEYEAFLRANGMTDENEYLSLMPDIIRADENLKGAKVIVSGVDNLTRKTVEILIALEKFCDLSVVTVSSPKGAYVNEVYYKIIDLFKSDCQVFEDGAMSAEHEAILCGTFSPQPKKAGLYSDKVNVFEFADVKSEVEYIAKKIKNEVVSGRRYKDYVIACDDTLSYAPLIKRVFADYGVPVYADEKLKLVNHPIVKLFSDVIQLKRSAFKPEVAISLVRNRLAFSDEDRSAFEDYLISTTPSRKMMRANFGEIQAELVRLKLFSMVEDIPARATVGEYVEKFNALFDNLNIDRAAEKLDEKLKTAGRYELAEFDPLAQKAFIATLGSAKKVVGELFVDLETFRSLIVSAASATEIGLIATGNDVIFLGDTTSAAYFTAKTLFFVGANSQVPKTKPDTAILCDKELIKIDGYDLVIEPKIKTINRRERQNVLTTLLSFDNELNVSYARLDGGGKPKVKGEIITSLEDIFGKKARRVQDEVAAHLAVAGVEDYVTKKVGIKRLLEVLDEFSSASAEDITLAETFLAYLKENDTSAYKSIIDYLSQNEELKNAELSYLGAVSATMIEAYFTCPYKAFGERLLRLTDVLKNDLSAMSIGTMAHSVLEKFTPIVKNIKKDEVENTVSALFDEVAAQPEYSCFYNKKQYEYVFAEIKNELKLACHELFDAVSDSDFSVLGTEIGFGKVGDKFGAIIIPTKFGNKKITGKIDRVDTFGDLARIIDYKTGDVSKKGDVRHLYSGKNIQLYLYSNVLRKTYSIAGVAYVGIDGKFKGVGGETVKFVGQSVEPTDGEFAVDKLVASVTKTDAAQLAAYADYAVKVAQSGANEMGKGIFIPTPTEKRDCEYCRLNGMCGYDVATGDRTRSEYSVKPQDIAVALTEGCDE